MEGASVRMGVLNVKCEPLCEWCESRTDFAMKANNCYIYSNKDSEDEEKIKIHRQSGKSSATATLFRHTKRYSVYNKVTYKTSGVQK